MPAPVPQVPQIALPQASKQEPAPTRHHQEVVRIVQDSPLNRVLIEDVRLAMSPAHGRNNPVAPEPVVIGIVCVDRQDVPAPVQSQEDRTDRHNRVNNYDQQRAVVPVREGKRV